MEETQTLAEKLKQALDNYTSYNGQNLNPVFLYMRKAERILKTNKNSGNSHKKLENLVLACKRKIVENNWGLLNHIVKSYFRRKDPYYDDFVSEAAIALLNAIPLYKLEKGKFSNYAGAAIRQRIMRRMQEILGNIKLPINFPVHKKEVEYFFELFKEKNGRIPNDEELADFSGKQVSEIKSLRTKERFFHTYSLDARLNNGDEKAGCLLDYFIDYRNCSMEEGIINKMTYQELINCINKLPNKKDRRILIGRLEGKTLQEITLEENLTKERIRQIEEKAIKKLKTMREFRALKRD